MKEIPYLSDEELSSLIQETENEPLINAPDYLKENILNRAAEISSVSKSSASKKQTFYIFSTKIVAGAAAAIALLFTIPQSSAPMLSTVSSEADEKEDSVSLTERTDSMLFKLNLSADKFCAALSDVSNFLVSNDRIFEEEQ